MKRKHLLITVCILPLLILAGCGDEEKPPEPVVENTNPIAYAPLVVGSSFTTRSHVVIDVRYRTQGCDASGHPTGITGAYDPDGDAIEYRFSCPWSVFKLGTSEKVNGEWVTFPIVTNPGSVVEQNAVVELWIGWTEDHPLMPTSPRCGPVIEPTVFTYEVKDEHGAITAHSVTLGR